MGLFCRFDDQCSTRVLRRAHGFVATAIADQQWNAMGGAPRIHF
jgi:hypothetical protein